MKKRGVELSMNVIIIAALALVVLVVLILLITRAVKNVDNGTGCSSKEGVCVELQAGESCGDFYADATYKSGGSSGCGAGETCCYRPLGDEAE